MRIHGKKVVDRSPEELWELLQDPVVLKRCMPGCEKIEKQTENTYLIKMRIRLGLFKSQFKGEVHLNDLIHQKSYTLNVVARSNMGHFNGKTSVLLIPMDGGARTELKYDGNARIGGTIASIGAKLFEGTARSFQTEFFNKLALL